MSNGPISQWRRGHSPSRERKTTADRLCAPNGDGKAYCGRHSTKVAETVARSTCGDCAAAIRADNAARSR